MASPRDVSDIHPHRVIVFSESESRLLGVMGEVFIDNELCIDPAFSMLTGIISIALSHLGNFDRALIPDAFPWAGMFRFEEEDGEVGMREYTPQALYLIDGVFSLVLPEGVEKLLLAVDVSGRLVAELEGEMTGANGTGRLN